MLPRQIKAIILNSGLYEGGMAWSKDFFSDLEERL